jgi:hypothetical protein
MSRRLPYALACLGLLAVFAPSAPSTAAGLYSGPLPQLSCDRQSKPETGAQGRVPRSEVDSGRSAKGYSCNTTVVGHFGTSGGFQVHRYVDKQGHECGYFDSTLLFPTDLRKNALEGLGVFVMDMKDPAHPKHVTSLTTPAMLSPHESLRLNAKRGLLAADMGSPATQVGFVDVYDVSQNCLAPVLQSSSPIGVLGHESAFSPDGTVFYVSSTGAHTLAAIDLTNPKVPSMLWFSYQFAAHGMSISDDGNRLYMADTGSQGTDEGGTSGLTILDVSRINKHETNPVVPVISHLTWPEVSIPQNAIPVTIKGRRYVVEVDEYTSTTTSFGPNLVLGAGYDPAGKVGAARMIDITDERHPRVVSNMRLAVNQPAARLGDQRNDPGAKFPVQGYAGHYCAVPTRNNPTYIACSFIVSGLRVFNIENPKKPYEMAYFNAPTTPGVYPTEGNFAMSAPAFVPKRNEIWYSDGFNGFYVVRLTKAAFAKGPLHAARTT